MYIHTQNYINTLAVKFPLITPLSFSPSQSSLAQLGIPLTDVVKVLVATLLLGNVLFYEAKNQELSMQGLEGTTLVEIELVVKPSFIYMQSFRLLDHCLV